MHRKQFLRGLGVTAVLVALGSASSFSQAASAGSADEAKALSARAAAFVKAKGPAVAYPAFVTGTEFKDRDLYVAVFDFKGNCLAHGANPKLVGKNLWESKDVNGVEIIQMQTRVAQTRGEGWSDTFTFVNPQTQALQPKMTYVQRVGETWLSVGYYK